MHLVLQQLSAIRIRCVSSQQSILFGDQRKISLSTINTQVTNFTAPPKKISARMKLFEMGKFTDCSKLFRTKIQLFYC